MSDERELDLMDGLRRAVEIAYWMSGSGDFSPEGKAHEGWLKAHTELRDIEKLLKPPSDRRVSGVRERRVRNERIEFIKGSEYRTGPLDRRERK